MPARGGHAMMMRGHARFAPGAAQTSAGFGRFRRHSTRHLFLKTSVGLDDDYNKPLRPTITFNDEGAILFGVIARSFPRHYMPEIFVAIRR